VQQTEGEDEQGAPPDVAAPDGVLDAHEDDRCSDQRLHDAGGDGDDTRGRQRQRHGVGQGKGRHLPQERAELRGEEEETQHEEDMVEAERHDMLEPRPDIAQEHRARALGQNLGTRQRGGQFPAFEEPFVGVLPTADLARDEGAPTGRHTDLHPGVPGR
jgi:hypothetical protein